MNSGLHDDELPVDIELVRNLIATQFPQYASLSLVMLGESGSSNTLFRLGDNLLVRMPRQPDGGKSIRKESSWALEIGGQLPFKVPEIVAVGQPDPTYDEHWSIVRWIEGTIATAYLPGEQSSPERATLARDLADLILALRRIEVTNTAVQDPTLRWYRGRPLAEFDQQTRRNIEQCSRLRGFALDLDAAAEIWAHAITLPGANEVAPDCWYHSDLVAENLLLEEGRLVAVLDFGGLAVGDPTIDLHGAWELLDTPAREQFRARLAVDDATWLRGRAWALAIALGAFAYYWEKMPRRMRDRLAMAQAVLTDAGV